MSHGTQWVVVSYDDRGRKIDAEAERNIDAALVAVIAVAMDGKIPALELEEFDDCAEWIHLDALDDRHAIMVGFPIEHMKLVRAERRNGLARRALFWGRERLQSIRNNERTVS